MPVVNFGQYAYYPSLQSSVGEHLGFKELSPGVKERLLPIFELSRRSKAADLSGSIAVTQETTNGSPFVLDLCHESAPPPVISRNPSNPQAAQAAYQQDLAAQQAYNNYLRQLLDPTDGFSAWRQLAAGFPNAIPVVQFTDPVLQGRAVLRQTTLFAANGGCVAVRIRLGIQSDAAPLIANMLAVLGSPDRLLIIFDCGTGRRRTINPLDAANEFVREMLRILDIDEALSLNIVFMLSSFTSRNHEGLQEFPNLDIPLWQEARQFYQYSFGDYAATVRRSSTFIPPDWRAQPVYALDDLWLAYRHHRANDSNGWVQGCQEIMNHARYQPAPQCWGVDQIVRASNNDLTGIDSSRYWYAAKVNIHISRMVGLVDSLINEDNGDQDGE